jgi:glycosyltransferase involved in cell wall biosynthesis
MWRNRTVSVVFPTYNEKDSIYEAIQNFLASGYVDEIVVVDNNAVEGTADEVAKTKARLVREPRQGYGYAIQRGLDEAKGDLLVISEPDGTFSGHDVVKLLAYSDDFDAVFGSRTTRELIWEGANMGWFLKWGNYAVAKLVEFLFNTTTLTDVGCTMRLLSKDAYKRLRGQFRVGGSHFGPEILLLTIRNRLKFVEIPVNYRERVGVSSVTGSRMKAFWLGCTMILMVFRHWFEHVILRRALPQK